MAKSRKGTRRFLKRVAERKGVDYRDAIGSFYGKKVSEVNKNVLISLMRERKSERIL